MALIELNFPSRLMQNAHTTHIILPDLPAGVSPAEFYGSGKKYKVVWLLHGGGGDSSDWQRKTSIEVYAIERNIAVVMPSVSNSRYSNVEHFGKPFFAFDYITDELMPYIYRTFPISDKREDNYVAGLSMGGEGALKLAFNRPDLFNAVACLSACARNYHTMDPNHPVMRKYMYWYGGLENVLASKENIWDRLPELAGKPECPRLFSACGTADNIAFELFSEFRRYVESLPMEAHFETMEGYKHEWRFWDIYIQKALDYFGLPEYPELRI